MNDDIEELKAMIEPLKNWKYWEYSCTDEDVKKAMENKSYIEVVLEEQSKTIKELQQELQRKDNIIQIMEKYLELIYDLGFDYDGCKTKEGLMILIDELVRYASLGRACNTTEVIYENGNNKYNILHEVIKK